MAIREYFVLGAVGILCVFSLAIGIEKMMKIILSNYLLIALCLTLPQTVTALLGRINIQAPDVSTVIAPYVTNKTIIVLVVYLLMLLLLFLKSRVSVHFHARGIQKFFLTLLCIPMTVVSITIALQIAVLGLQAFDVVALQSMVASLPIQDIYKNYILNTPVIICIHVFCTILVLSNINRTPKIPSFSFRKSQPSSSSDIIIED